MLTEIKNAQISFVSLVDKAANQRQFAIIKRAGEAPPFEKSAPILKVDEEKRIVTGVVYEPDTPDTHDEFMTAQEIEKAAHQFLKDYRNIDKQHDFTSGQGEVVESWIAKSDTTVGEQQIREGTWLMSVHVPDDEIWSEIKKGNITGFSMGGVGERVKQVTKSESEQATGLLKILKDFFGGNIQKGAMADNYNARIKTSNFWTAFSSLEETLQHYNWASDRYEFETDAGRIREALTEFSQIITDMLAADNVVKAMGRPPESVIKAGKKISAENMKEIKEAHAALSRLIELENEGEGEGGEVEKAQMKQFEDLLGQSIAKAIQPLSERVDALMKNEPADDAVIEGQNGSAAGVDMDEIQKTLTAAIKKQLEPLEKRIGAIEKARGASRQQEPAAEPVAKSGKSYMNYFA